MGWEGSVVLMNGLIAAAIDALSMLMSEPTVKSNVRGHVYILSLATLHYTDRAEHIIQRKATTEEAFKILGWVDLERQRKAHDKCIRL